MTKVKKWSEASNSDEPTKTAKSNKSNKSNQSNKEELINRINSLFQDMNDEIDLNGSFEESISIEIDLSQPRWDSASIIQDVINGACPRDTLNDNIPVVDEEEMIHDALADCESEISCRLSDNSDSIKNDWSDSIDFYKVCDLLKELQDKYGKNSNTSN